jgi:hypothetical protein
MRQQYGARAVVRIVRSGAAPRAVSAAHVGGI